MKIIFFNRKKKQSSFSSTNILQVTFLWLKSTKCSPQATILCDTNCFRNTPAAKMKSGCGSFFSPCCLENSFPRIWRLPVLTAGIVYHPPVTSQQALGSGPRESQSTERETLQGSAVETPDSCCLRELPKRINRANRKPRTSGKP